MSDEISRWEENGRPIPAPHSFKTSTILHLARKYRINIFIETGTLVGSTVSVVKDHFREVHSIELSDELYQRCVNSFKFVENVHLYHGSSEEVLPTILEKINEPVLFWLDAHYSAGTTAKGLTSSSLHKEVPVILGHPIENHVILIDDTYDMFDADGYLSPSTVEKMITEKYPNYKITIDGYILRAVPE